MIRFGKWYEENSFYNKNKSIYECINKWQNKGGNTAEILINPTLKVFDYLEKHIRMYTKHP